MSNQPASLTPSEKSAFESERQKQLWSQAYGGLRERLSQAREAWIAGGAHRAWAPDGLSERDKLNTDAISGWIKEALADPWELGEKKVWAAMEQSFNSSQEGLIAYAAATILKSFARLKEPLKSERLRFFGAMQTAPERGFSTLGRVAGEANPSFANELGRLSLPELLALGGGCAPGSPTSGAAQLAGASSANKRAKRSARKAMFKALESVAKLDPSCAQFALMTLDPPRANSGEPLKLEWPDPLLYRKAFDGCVLGAPVLLHLLSRHEEGDKALEWCQRAGFKGAAWPGSKIACCIGMDRLSDFPIEMTETNAKRHRETPRLLAFARLMGQTEALWESDKRALAVEFGEDPWLAAEIAEEAPWVFESVFESASRRALAWESLTLRLSAMAPNGASLKEWAVEPSDPFARSIVCALALSVGLKELPAGSRWALDVLTQEAKAQLESKDPGAAKKGALLERALLSAPGEPRDAAAPALVKGPRPGL